MPILDLFMKFPELIFIGFTLMHLFPELTNGFTLNKTYEHTTYSKGLDGPGLFFINNAQNAMGHYFIDLVPPDATEDPSLYNVITHYKMTITHQFTLYLNFGVAFNFIDGEFSGYQQKSYSLTDTTKYTHLWDFDIKFRGVKY